MIEEVHPINALVRMPMTAEPSLVVDRFFDLIQPYLRTVIYGGLIDHRQEHLRRSVLSGAGMGEDNVYFMSAYLFFHVPLCLVRGLFILPPTCAAP